jgi:hypothetical protein
VLGELRPVERLDVHAHPRCGTPMIGARRGAGKDYFRGS